MVLSVCFEVACVIYIAVLEGLCKEDSCTPKLGFDHSHGVRPFLYIWYRRLDKVPLHSPPWPCSSRSLQKANLEVVLMEILRQSFPGHNDQAVQYSASRQASVLAGINVSLSSKLWLCRRHNHRILFYRDHSNLPAPWL